MTEVIAVLVLIAGAVLSIIGFRQGTAAERERSRKIAEEAERRKKEQAARDAGTAMKEAAAERDAALKRPAGTVVGDFMRRGK